MFPMRLSECSVCSDNWQWGEKSFYITGHVCHPLQRFLPCGQALEFLRNIWLNIILSSLACLLQLHFIMSTRAKLFLPLASFKILAINRFCAQIRNS